MTAQPSLVTQRLRLRPLTAEDAPAVEHLAGAREIADTTLTIPHPYPPGAAVAWIATHAEQFAAGTAVVFGIELKEPRELVGSIGLHVKPEHANAEMGYWVGVPYWNRGYAAEAARALISYGFERLGLERIHAHYFMRNAASGRVMEKAGMTREGLLRRAVRKNGMFEDLVVYAILRDEYRGRPK